MKIRRIPSALLFCLLGLINTKAQSLNNTWPVLKSYTGDKLTEIAMPLGGIGTGTISIGGRGDLRDWEMTNRGALGWVPAVKLVEPTIANGLFCYVLPRARQSKRRTSFARRTYFKKPILWRLGKRCA